jgi:hypothetical protein
MRITRRVAALLLALALVIAAVVVTLAVVAGNSGASFGSARSAETTVTMRGGGSIRVEGATLRIPPGAVRGDGRLTARTERASAAMTVASAVTSALRLSLADAPVVFTLSGAKLVRAATLTLAVRPDAVPPDSSVATRADAVWLSYYDPHAHRWRPVPSRYDPSRHTVTAQISHLSLWAPLTWAWAEIGSRLRQALSALGSGQPPPPDCAGVSGVFVREAGGQDPPLMGCPTQNTPGSLTVTITSNRAYAMVLRPPADATPAPPDYKGFEDYVRNLQAVAKALGGSYLAPTAAFSYTVPLNGPADVFSAGPSWKTYVLDLAVPVADALFDTVTLGYADCILDSVTITEPSLADAPGLIKECLPGLAEELAVVKLYDDYIAPALNYVQDFLQAYDLAHDAILKVHGEVQLIRPNPTPELYVSTGYEPGEIYRFPKFPAQISFNRSAYISGLSWTQIGTLSATATGTLNTYNATNGAAEAYTIQIYASDPEECAVILYPHGFPSPTETIQAYVFSDVRLTALQGIAPPDITAYTVSPACHPSA